MSIERTLSGLFLRFCIALCVGAIGGIGAATAATSLDVPAEGWVTWSVPAVADAPDWCCFDWDGKRKIGGRCDLDSANGSYGSHDGTTNVALMRIYARLSGGRLQQIRALGPTCPAETKSAIADLGSVPSDDSARWLERQLDADDQITTDLLAAIAIHAGPVARDVLGTVARDNESKEARKDALFWMGQVRASDSAQTLRTLMFDDGDPDIREHAAFSLAQSDVAGKTNDLIRLGANDPSSDVRAIAWFWLAQTEAPESEAAIADALVNESDESVRERAIFALSQLPDERAIDALRVILEDPSRSHDDRKHALFWLGQNDSPRAADILASLLSGP